MAFALPRDPRDAAWFAAGARAAHVLDGRGAAAVVGRDPVATAWAALGLAQAIAPARRVAVADLIGLPAPFAELLGRDARGGIAEAFLDGVPLTQVAQGIDGLPNAFLLPAGDGPVQREDIVGSDRWRRLTAGFAEVGAVLLACTVSGAPGLDALVANTGGAICVGTDVLLDSSATTLATLVIERQVERPAPVAAQGFAPSSGAVGAPLPSAEPDGEDSVSVRGTATSSATVPATAPAPAPPLTRRPTSDFRAVLDDVMRASPTAVFTPVAPPGPRRATQAPPSWHSAPPPRWRTWTAAIAVFVLMASVGAALALWRRDVRDGLRTGLRRATGVLRPARGETQDSAAEGPLADRPAGPLPALVVSNPGDSLVAAAWAVEVVAVNTEAGARARLADATPGWPAGTWAPTTLAGSAALWYRVFVGANATRSAADSLLLRLRAGGVLASDGGRVVRVPYAFQLAAGVPSDSATAYVARLRGVGLPVYALRRADGRDDVLCGAFETPQQAALLVPPLRAARMAPTLVYRTGRPQ